MSMNFGIDTYNMYEIVRAVRAAINEQCVSTEGKLPVEVLVQRACDTFGVVDGGSVHVLSCEYWEEYDPSANFPMAIAGYYGLKDKWYNGMGIVLDLAKHHYGAGVTAAEWLEDKFGIELDEEE